MFKKLVSKEINLFIDELSNIDKKEMKLDYKDNILAKLKSVFKKTQVYNLENFKKYNRKWFSESFTPRRLSMDELDYILEVLNIPSSDVFYDIKIRAIESLKRSLKLQLFQSEISPICIEELKYNISQEYRKSKIKVGEAVGAWVAESISQMVMQATMNTFHQAGSNKNMTGGINKLKEIINATKNPKYKSTRIIFKDDLTFEQCLQKREEIVSLAVEELINTYEIIPIDNSSWSFTLFNIKPESNFFVRIYVNSEILYKYKIHIGDLAKFLSIVQSKNNLNEVFKYSYSSLSDGYIDLYPIKDNILKALDEIYREQKFENLMLDVFITNIYLPNIKKTYYKGVSGIIDYFPQDVTVWTLVKATIKDNDTWLLIIDDNVRKSVGCSYKKLLNFLESQKLQFEEIKFLDFDAIRVKSIENPEKIFKALNSKYYKLRTLISVLDNENKINISEFTQRQINFNQIIEIVNLFKFTYKGYSIETFKIINQNLRDLLNELNPSLWKSYYAIGVGLNTKELFERNDIDTTKSHSDFIHELYEMFGIEAVRNFMLMEFKRYIEKEGYINVSHIILAMEFICNTGEIKPLGFLGIAKQPIGPLELALFRDAGKVLTNAAVQGRKENLRESVYSSIMVGVTPRLGHLYNKTRIQSEKIDFEENVLEIEELDDDFMSRILGIQANVAIAAEPSGERIETIRVETIKVEERNIPELDIYLASIPAVENNNTTLVANIGVEGTEITRKEFDNSIEQDLAQFL